MEDTMATLRQLLDQWDSDYLLYLDDEDHLAIPVAERLQRCADQLLTGQLTFAQLHRTWPDWFPVAESFAVAYDLDDVLELYDEATLGGDEGELLTTVADRRFLDALTDWLDRYVLERMSGRDF